MSDPLLEEICRRGWTQQLTERFEREYGPRLRHSAVAHMRRLRLIQPPIAHDRVHRLSAHQLEICERALDDLYDMLLDGLPCRYVEGVEKGEIESEFVPYASGIIRHRVIHNARRHGLLPDETPLQLLEAICRARDATRRREKIAWAKCCLGDQVKVGLRSRCPSDRAPGVLRKVHCVVDYFFEQFVPTRCEALAKLGPRALDRLLDEFAEGGEFDNGIGYVGTITPFWVKSSPGMVQHIEDLEESMSPEYVEGLLGGTSAEAPIAQKPLREERLGLWDQLLRGLEVDPDEAEGALFPMAREAPGTEQVACVVLLAAVQLAYTGTPVMRRNLRAALRYWFSRTGTKSRPRRFNSKRDLEGGGLCEVMGLYLTWPEAMESVGGNPRDYTALQRVTEALRDEYGKQWERFFGSTAPGMPLGGDL